MSQAQDPEPVQDRSQEPRGSSSLPVSFDRMDHHQEDPQTDLSINEAIAQIPSARRESILNSRPKLESPGSSSRDNGVMSNWTGKGKSRDRSGDDMELAPFTTSVAINMEKQKMDDALAKWRKWVLENPSLSTETSLIRPPVIPPIRSSSDELPSSVDGRLSLPNRQQSDPTNDASHRSMLSLMRIGDLDVYATESVKMLSDVELAVDSLLLNPSASSPGGPSPKSRHRSILPRLSPLDNPFMPIATRMSSRRVRPIVLELIHALGHYIHTLWSIRQPGTMCVWVAETSTGKQSKQGWNSKTITAVHYGIQSGHYATTSNQQELEFWRDEVKWTLSDAIEVVGVVKRSGKVFKNALEEGQYGDIMDENVLGNDYQGGNLTRLLSDLEEALWGAGPPRSTDLAFELPGDFDPYADTFSEQLSSALQSNRDTSEPILAFLQSDSTHSDLVTSPMDHEVDQVPDMVVIVDSDQASSVQNPIPTKHVVEGSYWGFQTEEGSTLEDIGKKRHQEWLASRKAIGSS